MIDLYTFFLWKPDLRSILLKQWVKQRYRSKCSVPCFFSDSLICTPHVHKPILVSEWEARYCLKSLRERQAEGSAVSMTTWERLRIRLYSSPSPSIVDSVASVCPCLSSISTSASVCLTIILNAGNAKDAVMHRRNRKTCYAVCSPRRRAAGGDRIWSFFRSIKRESRDK